MDGKDMQRKNSGRTVAVWRIASAWLALAWERLWPALWPAVGAAGLYLLLALTDVLPMIAGWLHALILVLFAAAVLVLGWRSLRRLRLPGHGATLRRLERVNDLQHRPLDAVSDELEAGVDNAETRRLWQLHQDRMRKTISRLRIGWPSPGLIRRDPFALRLVLGVALTVALILVDDPVDRVARALTPDLTRVAAGSPAKLDAWITPPEYTRTAPIFLASGADGKSAPEKAEIVVPFGSMLVARISGGSATPELTGDGSRIGFQTPAAGSHQLEHKLIEGGDLSIRQGRRVLGGWKFTVTPDNPPAVTFVHPPSRTRRNAMRLDFQAIDDYGVEKVVARIGRSGAVPSESALAKFEPIELDLPLPGLQLRQVKSTSYNDLTAHPWAGLPVNLVLTATDAAGQTGSSKTVQMVLPERAFTHPVARAIIGLRKQLALYPEKNRNRVAAQLEQLAWEYEQYNGDTVVFLSLSTVSRRLDGEKLDTPEKLLGVLQLLWNVALRIEDGNLSLSERALRDVQQALQDALSKKSTDAEIERLLKEFERALGEYLNALEEKMRSMPQQRAENLPPDARTRMLRREDIKKLLDRIRELSRSGQRDAARQMLSQLRNMLENLRTRQFARPSGRQRRAMKMLNELQDIIRQQQGLLDRTFKEAQRRGQMRGATPNNPMMRLPPNFFPPGSGQRPDGDKQSPAPMAEESETQEQLRRRLGEMMRQLGEISKSIPRALGRAERSMNESSERLGSGQAGKAVPPQTRAIDQLQQGARSATEQLMRQLGRGQRPGEGTEPFGNSRRAQDPFGRDVDKTGRSANTNDVEIPDQESVQGSRRIRDELRRRAGERQRPKFERDYIDRLLKQF